MLSVHTESFVHPSDPLRAGPPPELPQGGLGPRGRAEEEVRGPSGGAEGEEGGEGTRMFILEEHVLLTLATECRT